MRGCSCRGTAGFAHVSCLAEQAKILVAEAEENNLGDEVFDERFRRWNKCSLCEQDYHGVVACALGWACWKTYVGRQEADQARRMAMTDLGNGLYAAVHDADALCVQEAELSMERRLGAPEEHILVVQGNIASTHQLLGRGKQALLLRRDVYFGFLKLKGEENVNTLREADNYAVSFFGAKRFQEAKSLLRKTILVARRVLGENDGTTLRMRFTYAETLYKDDRATLGDLREAASTLEETERITRRVLGVSHPVVVDIEESLQEAQEAGIECAHSIPDQSPSPLENRKPTSPLENRKPTSA